MAHVKTVAGARREELQGYVYNIYSCAWAMAQLMYAGSRKARDVSGA